jgi:hypothetical protein
MKVNKQAQNELKRLIALATVRCRQSVEVERTSSASFVPSAPLVHVCLDLYALGTEAYLVSEYDSSHWEDGFTGVLYSLSQTIEEAIGKAREAQIPHLRELSEVVDAIDEWHSKHIAS